jgi:hypothetical protein
MRDGAAKSHRGQQPHVILQEHDETRGGGVPILDGLQPLQEGERVANLR